MDNARPLVGLDAGQLVPFGGDRVAVVSAELAQAFTSGDRLVVVQDSGALLHIPHAEHTLVRSAIDRATHAFNALASVTDAQISAFFEAFAVALEDVDVFAQIKAANDADVRSAAARGRSTTRLELSARMRADMIDGLRVWRDSATPRQMTTEQVHHVGWTVSVERAPLGVVGFVFEGRPNVFTDACGVLRTGNTAVLRIGSDALGTAQAIMRCALTPALELANLPPDSIVLVTSPAHAAGWALFNDARLSLAIARGSGDAVSQLGAVARQAGVPVSLHGTGGAWMVASSHADPAHFRQSVLHSLDRKVCNTLNVCCIVADRAAELVPIFIDAVRAAGELRSTSSRLHVEVSSAAFVPRNCFSEVVTIERAGGTNEEPFADLIGVDALGTEWEWENSPEVSLVVVDSVAEAVTFFNRFSPNLAASLISADSNEHDWFYAHCDAPFIGNGFTRWVDGQFALNRPELGLSNWEAGRLFARSAVLSGDSVYTMRLRAAVTDSELHR
jgi:glutamate-5-semialdehyde dehydrogenase